MDTILFAILFAITIWILFVNIGPVMGKKTDSGSIICFASSHSVFSKRLQKD